MRALPFLLAALLGACAGDEPEQRARRVILITCDTLRADRLGVYGYDRETSPHLDALAAEGVVFDAAYSCAPHTGPALSSMLASRMPDEIGVAKGNRSLMPPEVLTFPEVLRDAGIATAAVVSNWALRRSPPEDGDIGVQQGFEHYDDRMGAEELNREGHFERLAPGTTDAAIAWLEGRPRQDDDRFFLWVHYQDPHGPYTPPAEYAALFDQPLGDARLLPVGEKHRGLHRIPSYQVLDGERHPDFYRNRYDAEIRYFDEELGRLLDWLRAHGLYEDSLIVFTADHGESLGEHDYWFCHGENVYREVVRVPFVVRYPAGLPRPAVPPRDGVRRTDTLIGHLDVWPTVLQAFGLAPGLHRGSSLLVETLPTGRIAAHTLGEDDTSRRWLGITHGRHRLLLHDGRAMLFDVEADPGEERDLARRLQGRVGELQGLYREFLERLPARAALAGTEMHMDEETLRAMQALGYVEAGEAGDE